ncbi:uncharacterized protein STEHIDRAFT_114791 [Stereum hirsutum FP-91666 SS1]|uniref:uncharacterized protein n=1 Tax=Stereum hirsutum (strain FP-91666) TaxID=721885 RepID=UPI00044492D1|nr:uncharacterized protein STEHIDRAFT_114791 [Stereum hirsutum FP-91666 SS1]EIM82167.1 hypothetical protein STEHIDRAFT_114791 [Stereum hirsutum FP-91666 SS1]
MTEPKFTSSEKNTRIERTWVEVGSQFARRWRAFFVRLEKLHGLDRLNAAHLWLLHTLFLEPLNKDCADFVDAWNHQPISGPVTRNASPLDIRFLSFHEHGIEEDQPGVNPTVLNEYYGVEGLPRRRPHGETGAGHPDDEADDTDNETDVQDDLLGSIDDTLADDLEEHIRHDAIPVPPSSCPFSPTSYAIFLAALDEIHAREVIPEGYGIMPEEWAERYYPLSETITFGVGGKKKLKVILPEEIWWPRALAWVQGLDLMQTMLVDEDGE